MRARRDDGIRQRYYDENRRGPDALDDADAPGAPRRRPSFVAASGALFAAIAAFMGADLAGDTGSGAGRFHVAFELAVMALALVGVAVIWSQLAFARRRAHVLAHALDRTRGDLERWRTEAQDHLRGLAAAIDRQFERWGLSPAEAEVALLVLKGLSLKEVAQLRATSERTVRQQALSVYRKAGLAGRAELSAFFLEDLLTPRETASPPREDTPQRGAR